MRIVIDFQGAQTASRFRGIGRYTTALTRAILRNAGGHEVWLVLNGAFEQSVLAIRTAFDGLVPQERIRVFETPGQIAEMDPRAAPRCRAAELIREQFIALLEPDVVLVTSLFEGYVEDAIGSVGTFVDGRRTAVILYDLIPLLNPEQYLVSPSQRRAYLRKIDSLKRAGLLLAISDYAREEAIGALELAPERVVAISTAIDESFAPSAAAAAELAAVRAAFGIARPMIMCAPGGYDPRKNLPGLITAFSLLPATLRVAHQLLIASRLTGHEQQSLRAHAQRCGLGPDELILTGYVSDEDLVKLYQAATLFVLPSLHEGFGMPVLEAMACGTPSIGSNTTSIPEVIGLQEAMFDPADPQSIAERIAAVLGDPALYQRLRDHGRLQAAKFSWDSTAVRALRALEAHVAATPPAPLRARADLMQALASVPGLAGDEPTLLALALCLAALPNQAAPRQMLFDLDLLDLGDGAGGAPGRDLLLALLRDPPPATAVEPVALSRQGGVWHYRYARREAQAMLGLAPAHAPSAVADLRAGDVLLCAASASLAQAEAAQDGLFAHLRRIGVQLHVVLAGPEAAQAPAQHLAPHASRIIRNMEALREALRAAPWPAAAG